MEEEVIIKVKKEPLTDISGIELKTCRPHGMRLTPSACALLAERARRVDKTSRGDAAPFVLHSAESEIQRLKYCFICPDAEPPEKARICRTPNCHNRDHKDGLCSRCWYRQKAERRKAL